MYRLGAGFRQPPGEGSAIVVAAGRRSLVLLGIRTRPADEADAEVERTIRALALLDV
jgi:hypothetical protein